MVGAWRGELRVSGVQVAGVLVLLKRVKKQFSCSAREVGSEQATTADLDALLIMIFNPCHAFFAFPDVNFFSMLSLSLILARLAFLLNSLCSSLTLTVHPVERPFSS